MNTQDYNTLTEVIEAMIDEGEKPIKAIAAEIGKPYPTLKRELNPADDGAKLGADVLLGIMASCGSIAPLEWLADRLGYVVKPKEWQSQTSRLGKENPWTIPYAVARWSCSCRKKRIRPSSPRLRKNGRTR